MNKYGELLTMVVEYKSGCTTGEVMTEGVNWDIHKLSKQFKADKKTGIANIKAYITRGEYDKAKKEIGDQREIFKRYKKMIESIDSTLGATIIGFVCHAVFTSLKAFLAGVATLPLLRVGSLAVMLYDAMKSSYQQTKAISRAEEFSFDAFNSYKGQVLHIIGKTLKLLDKMEKECDNLKKDKDEGTKVESASTPTDLQIKVYESALNGDITADQRNLLLALTD